MSQVTDGLKQALQEQFQAYPDDYPMQSHNFGNWPTEDSLSNLRIWVENAYEHRNEHDFQGGIDDYYNICIEKFIEYFEISDGEFDEPGETMQFILDQLGR